MKFLLKLSLPILLLGYASLQAQDPDPDPDPWHITAIQVKSGFSFLPVSDADHNTILVQNTADGPYSNNFRHISNYTVNYHGSYSAVFMGITLKRGGAKPFAPELRIGLAVADLKPYKSEAAFEYGGWQDTGIRYTRFSNSGKFLFNSFNADYLFHFSGKHGISYVGINANIGQASWFSRNITLVQDSAGIELNRLKTGSTPVSTLTYGVGATLGFKFNLVDRIQILAESYAGFKNFARHLDRSPKPVYDFGLQLGVAYTFPD